MPTAPRRPTQEMKASPASEKRNGARHRNTAAGRATNISASATAAPARCVCDKTLRPDQQAEQHEHHDLGEPGHGIEEHHDRVVGARRPIADHEAGEIDGEKARGVQRRGKAEDDQRARRHERRMQALRAAPSRLSTSTMARPPSMPKTVPSTACSASTASDVLPRAIADR